MPLMSWLTLELGNTRRPQETRVIGLPGWGGRMTISLAIWIQYTNVTDKQTPDNSKDHAYHYSHSYKVWWSQEDVECFTKSWMVYSLVSLSVTLSSAPCHIRSYYQPRRLLCRRTDKRVCLTGVRSHQTTILHTAYSACIICPCWAFFSGRAHYDTTSCQDGGHYAGSVNVFVLLW